MPGIIYFLIILPQNFYTSNDLGNRYTECGEYTGTPEYIENNVLEKKYFE